MSTPAPHMTPDEFRRHGAEVIEWIASYMERVTELPVLSGVEPGEIRAGLPEHPPARGTGFDGVLADLDSVLLPGITHWQHPSFFAFFPANATGPSILGELLSAGLGVQGMLWATSPACTELEALVCDWMVELCGLPEVFRSDGPGGGVIQGSASEATLCAVLAARDRARAAGADLGRLRAYVTADAHSSFVKDLRIAGLPDDQHVVVPTDATHAMDPGALAETMAADVAVGLVPFFVGATVGTTSSTAIDPVPAIVDAAAPYGAWVHVDGAFAGVAAVCPELRFVNEGLGRVDSYAFNPHKWLLTNFDCTCFYVADRAPLLAALSVVPEYLRNAASESGAVVDYRDWQVPLGRRFRALKLWMVIRWYGAEGLAAHIRHHVELTRRFAQRVEAHPDFELAAPVPLALVCFRHRAGDDVTRALMDRINGSGRAYLTHTVLDGRFTLRLAVGSVTTEEDHVTAVWDQLVELAAELVAGGGPDSVESVTSPVSGGGDD